MAKILQFRAGNRKVPSYYSRARLAIAAWNRGKQALSVKASVKMDYELRLKYVRCGHSRDVILLGSTAIKFPKLTYGWKGFVKGLLCNMNELAWWRLTRDERLCPVKFWLPGGFLLAMARTESIGVEGEYSYWYGFHGLPVEHKLDSIGILNGRVVAIDYGDAYGGELTERTT